MCFSSRLFQFYIFESYDRNRIILPNSWPPSNRDRLFSVDCSIHGRNFQKISWILDLKIFLFFFIKFQNHGETNTVSDLEVVCQLNMIRDKILAKADSQLHNHLIQLDIPLPLFGMYVATIWWPIPNSFNSIIFCLSSPV